MRSTAKRKPLAPLVGAPKKRRSSPPRKGRAVALKPPPLPKLTREQLGAPELGTENEQDPGSPPGVTRAMAWTAKYGHVHIRPISERIKAEREKKAVSFIVALKDLIQPAEALLKHDMNPADLVATIQGMKGKVMAARFNERMDALEALLTRLNSINAMQRKVTT